MADVFERREAAKREGFVEGGCGLTTAFACAGVWTGGAGVVVGAAGAGGGCRCCKDVDISSSVPNPSGGAGGAGPRMDDSCKRYGWAGCSGCS